MKSETVEFDVSKAYGKDLPKAIPVKFDISLYENENEIPVGERLNSEQYVQAVNARRKAKMRAAETEKALKAAGYERPDQNDPEVIAEQQVKLIMKLHKVPEAVAKQIYDAQQKFAASLVQQPA